MKTLREKIVDRGKFLVLIGCAMIAFLFALFGVIAVSRPNGVDVYVTLIGPVLPVLIGLVVIGSQLDDVKKKVAQIEHQTNGQLTAQLDAVKQHVTDVVADRVSVEKDD